MVGVNNQIGHQCTHVNILIYASTDLFLSYKTGGIKISVFHTHIIVFGNLRCVALNLLQVSMENPLIFLADIHIYDDMQVTSKLLYK